MCPLGSNTSLSRYLGLTFPQHGRYVWSREPVDLEVSCCSGHRGVLKVGQTQPEAHLVDQGAVAR